MITSTTNGAPDEYDLLADVGAVVTKNNRLTIDDATRQMLSQQEIEDLKKSSGGKEIIDKILANHAGLDEKTDFSKAKYTLRKTKKYLKRFTVLPVDIGNVMQYITDKEPPRIMELREEILGLMTAWGNVHYTEGEAQLGQDGKKIGGGRWLVVDETGGLIVAALAEKMGILYSDLDYVDGTAYEARLSAEPHVDYSGLRPSNPNAAEAISDPASNLISHRDFAVPALTNTITVIHPCCPA